MFKEIEIELMKLVDPKKDSTIFFKTGKDDYAENDKFISISVPNLRSLAKRYLSLELKEIEKLLESEINEYRQLALIILSEQYAIEAKKSNSKKRELYEFYLNNLRYVNNWNLVDCSAHLIVGRHVFDTKEFDILEKLAKSTVMWERRVAMVATWYLIRKNELDWVFKLSNILIYDEHDLIHKAVGWMLREAGKKNMQELRLFLDMNLHRMPRTMLRYAIERFEEKERKEYLNKKH